MTAAPDRSSHWEANKREERDYFQLIFSDPGCVCVISISVNSPLANYQCILGF